MATLTAKLTLVSNDILPSESLSLSAEKASTVLAPAGGISLALAPASNGTEETIKNSATSNQYVYIKHTGKQADGATSTTNELIVKFGSVDTIRLKAFEFAFFPCKSDVLVNIISESSHVIQVEHAFFSAG